MTLDPKATTAEAQAKARALAVPPRLNPKFPFKVVPLPMSSFDLLKEQPKLDTSEPA